VRTAGTNRSIPAYSLYGESPRRGLGRPLHVETIETRSARHHWMIAPHVHHSLHQIVFVRRGAGVVLADGQRSQYRPPALMLMPRGVVHGFEFEPGTQGHVITVATDILGEMSGRERGVASLFERPAVFDLRARGALAPDIARSVRLLAREAGRIDAGQRLTLHGCLEVLLGNLLRLLHARPNLADPAIGQRHALMALFEELVERRFRQHPSVADMARALHVSQSRLRAVCLEATGRSPIQLIHARIVLEAKRQLHYTSISIREVAYALGFDDAAYFTRFFSRLVGTSPRRFRSRGADRESTTADRD